METKLMTLSSSGTTRPSKQAWRCLLLRHYLIIALLCLPLGGLGGRAWADNENPTVTDWANEGRSGDDWDNAYIINTKEQLDLLAHRVNGTHGETANDYEGKYFKLGQDITYDPNVLTIDNDNDGTNDSNYEAIGGYFDRNYRYFMGNIDGQGNTVSGIRIYKGGDDESDRRQGLFGQTGVGVIRGITLANAHITGYDSTGGIVGTCYNDGTVSNCHVAADVTIHAVKDEASDHGGIVGGNFGSVSDCTSAATLTRAESANFSGKFYGGIAGSNYGTLSHNLAIGALVPATTDNSHGALCGGNDNGTLMNNYYHACTIAGTENATNAGCGHISNDNSGYTTDDVTVGNGAVPAYALTLGTGVSTSTPATKAENGFLYNGTSYYRDALALALTATGLDAPTEGYRYAYTIDGNEVAWSEGSTTAATLTVSAAHDGKTVLATNRSAIDWATESSGDESHPYMIFNPEQLDLLAKRVNDLTSDYNGKYFKLGQDIKYDPNVLTIDNDNDGTNDSNYTPIGISYENNDRIYFCGHFDGAGHTISGIRIYRNCYGYKDMYQGIFGQTGGADIRGITLADAHITGYIYTGGIAGYIYNSSVSDCHATATVSIRASRNYTYYLGGIVGFNCGTVSHCTSAATLPTNSYYHGAIVGANSGGVMRYNLAIGAVVPKSIYPDYNRHGAICGVNVYGGVLDHNYYFACTVAGVKNATCVGCDISNNYETHNITDVAEKDGAVRGIILYDNSSKKDINSYILTTVGNAAVPRVALADRTLYKDGKWNTLSLPFNVTAEQMEAKDNQENYTCPLHGATIKELDTDGYYDDSGNVTVPGASASGLQTGFDSTDGTLNLFFKEAVTKIEAGKPYIIKWSKPSGYDDKPSDFDITNPVFTGVTVNAAAPAPVTSTDRKVSFVGNYEPIVGHASQGTNTILYLGAGNKLYYPEADMTIGAFRSYFQLRGITAGEAPAVRLFFGDSNEETGIKSLTPDPSPKGEGRAAALYSLDGRRVRSAKRSASPLCPAKNVKKGVFIFNGKKIIIK